MMGFSSTQLSRRFNTAPVLKEPPSLKAYTMKYHV